MTYNITNETQLDRILVNMSSNIPILFPMLLFFIFIVIALAGAFSNQRRSGYTNIPMWFSISGLVTTTSAFILFLVDGLINLATLGTCVALTMAFVLWFFFSGDE